MDHPPQALLLRFAEGRADREEARRVVAHLLKGCPECGGVLGRAAPEPSRDPLPEDAYDEVFDRLLKRARTLGRS